MLQGLYQGINVVSCAKSARTSSTRSVILSQIDNKKKQRTYSLSQLAACLVLLGRHYVKLISHGTL